MTSPSKRQAGPSAGNGAGARFTEQDILDGLDLLPGNADMPLQISKSHREAATGSEDRLFPPQAHAVGRHQPVSSFLRMQAGEDADSSLDSLDNGDERYQLPRRSPLAQAPDYLGFKDAPSRPSTNQTSAKGTAKFTLGPSHGPSGPGTGAHATLEPQPESHFGNNVHFAQRLGGRSGVREPSHYAKSGPRSEHLSAGAKAGGPGSSDRALVNKTSSYSGLQDDYLEDENGYDWLRLEAGSDPSASDSAYERVRRGPSRGQAAHDAAVQQLFAGNGPRTAMPPGRSADGEGIVIGRDDYAQGGGAFDSLNDRILIASPIRDEMDHSSESSCPSGEVRSRIIADAGEDFSLLQIAGIARPGDDSITASVAEKTDRIIN